MKKIWILITVVAVSLFMCALPLFAFTVKGGENVSITTSINDDFYAFGSNIMVLEDIEGDLIAAGGRIEVTGKVIQLRFGLQDGHPRTLEEVGREFGVTRERIRQIESKTLGKLRHPNRSGILRDFLEH
ncbi:unnamed protein product [marine sediment metagenome]|uniref:RNA polymerase sigma-70 domain-containing protein n=1 Tax=marine sediment metagenome TaxID=412755 RepID=X1CRB6_9ZZZZ